MDSPRIKDGQIAYIKGCMDAFEKAMVHEYIGCYDAAGSNQYMIKRDSSESTKIEMTTAWDFDGVMNVHDENCSANINRIGFFYTKKLLQRDDFKALCKERYSETRDIIKSFIEEKIDSLDSNAINQARVYDAARWGVGYETVESQKERISNWLTNRLNWMDNQYK